MKQIGFLSWNLRACSKPLKELSYKQFVLPIIDYASSVWDPYHQGNINKLEMIQHGGARFVLNQPWQRNVRDSVSLPLQSLNWPTLQIRRVCSRLVLLYTIINQIIQIPAHYLPTQSPITTRTRNAFITSQALTVSNIHFFQELSQDRTNCHSILSMLTRSKALKNYFTVPIILCNCTYLMVFVH